MPDRDRWRRGDWRRGPPPWWPQGHPFPPQGRPGPQVWRALRRRFLWRAAFLLAVMVFLGVALTLLVGAIAGALTGRASFLAALAALLLIPLVLAIVGRFTRAAAPVGELIEAAGRVESGDYAARVTERGPREVRSLARAFNAMSAQLEETDELRRRLLADVSHELRTPLTVIQGNLEGILDGIYPANEAALRPILDETRVLGRLVDDVRTLALTESGALELHREPTDMAALLGDAAAGFRAQADEAGVALEVTAASALPVLEVDATRLHQVLANLLANALHATPRGGRVEMRAEREEGGVAVSVADSGAGIPADRLEGVFDRFSRSPDSPGSGLGLAIARNLVEAHGGTISAESRVGQGTTVRFALPEGR